MGAGRAFELGQQTMKESKPCAPASGRGACSIERLSLVDPSPKEIRHLFGNLFFASVIEVSCCYLITDVITYLYNIYMNFADSIEVSAGDRLPVPRRLNPSPHGPI
jgi:hypothetical protein